MTDQPTNDAPTPSVEPKQVPIPRWAVRSIWVGHRFIYSATRGRVGLRIPKTGKYGTLRLTTVGRSTGKERKAVLAYLEDGPNLLLMAMNGWAEPAPAWYLNLQAHPDASVELPDVSREVRARTADEDERPRLWAKWGDLDEDIDAYAAAVSHETPVIILEPRPA
jgi:deazaflavin-dependent oxidoreductase (nitroreductase family)